MTYVKAIAAALLAALVLGVATGSVVGVLHALETLAPADKATILAASISEAMNNTALFITVLVPLAVVLVFAVRRWRRRSA